MLQYELNAREFALTRFGPDDRVIDPGTLGQVHAGEAVAAQTARSP